MNTQKCPKCGGELVNNNGIYTCEQCQKSFKAKNAYTAPAIQPAQSNEIRTEEIKSNSLCVVFKENAQDLVYFVAGILLGLFMSIFGVAVACSVAPFVGRRDMAKGSLIGFFTELGLGILGGIIALIVVATTGNSAS